MSSSSYSKSTCAPTERIKFADDTEINTGPRIEYKEYSFQTHPNKEIETKVSEFWKTLGNRKPPSSQLFRQQDLSECFKSSISAEEEEILDDDEKNIVDKTQKYKWTNTFCLFKHKGLQEAANAAVPKKCKLCDNKYFDPKFADEDCSELIKDIGNLEETNFESPKMHYIQNK